RRPDPDRVGVHPRQRPPDPGPDPAPGLSADPRQHHGLHPRAPLDGGLGGLGHHDRGPPPVQLPGAHRRQHPGNRDTNPAAVRTRSSAPREVSPSIGATLTAANSETNPTPRSTATHDPSP